MAINKVEFGNQTLIDLTGDTATPEDVLGGKTFHTKSGEASVGTAGPYAGSDTNGGAATTAKKLFGQDTRSVNSPPSFYLASGQNSTLVTEFKNRAVIDAPGSSNFGTLITVTPWMDSSGGLPVQTYVDNTGQKAIRFAQTSETWGSWSTLASNSDIPSVGNGTIKLQRNGVDIMTFTTNQNSNVTGNLIIPTKVSELTNDSEFISDDDPRLTDSRNAKDVYAWAKAATKPSYTAAEVGLGNVGNFKAVSTVASQGLTDTEKSNARANIGAGTSSFSGSYNDLTNKPTIPTVNNATLTIQKNGTNVQTFTANQSTNATANITVPTKTSDLTNDSGYTTNTGTVTSVAAGTGLSGGTITSSGTISLANHSADYLSGGYLNIHPENGPTLIPFMNNDIAYLLKRGGSAIVKYDGTQQSVDISNCFDASPSYWAINPTNITTVVIELTLHKVFAWTNTIYVDFGSAGWRAKNVKIEVMNSNYAQDVWTQKYNNTNNGLGHCYVVTSHTPVGASNAGGGFNKIRFTLSSWGTSTGFRIAQLGVYNYGSAGLRETFVPRDGGTLFGAIKLAYPASATMTYQSANPQIGFSERDGAQGVKIIYTDYDTYRAPYGLKVIGDGSATGGAWFEVEGNLYSNGGKQVPYLSTTPTSGQVVVTDGTTGGVKSSGYTIAKSVPSDAVFTDNNTTYTFATGDSNGQIKVTPSGGTAQNVSVKGLGSAAYTASTAYAAASHTHTINQVTWAGGQNLATSATANGQEWSIDMTPGSYTGTYFQVWSTKNSKTVLACYADNNKVTVPNGNLEVGGAASISGNLTVASVNGETVKYTSSVNAVVGDTTCTISDSSIATTSLIESFSSNSTGDTIAIKNIAVTAGQAVLTFKALTVDTSFRLRITNV